MHQPQNNSASQNGIDVFYMNTLSKFAIGLFWGLFVHQCAIAGPAADAFSRKDYNESYRLWSKTPNTSEAKYGIGRILLEGLGGSKDTEKGLASIKNAASAGYGPAIEYLADFYQRSGAYNAALPYLRRLQETSKSLKRQEEIVRAIGSLTKKPHSINRDFCGELKTLSELGGSADKVITKECALNGLPSSMTKAQAESELKATLVSSPSFESLVRLAPVALNPDSDGFDPKVVLDALIKIDPTLSSNDSKNLLSTGSLSKNICVSLPTSNRTQKITQLSYCALTALAGDRQLSITSAMAFASGEFGQKSADLAIKFAQLAGSPTELNGLQLRMFSENPSKWKEHLDFLSTTVQTLSSEEVNAAIRFQSNLASKRVSNYTTTEYAKLLNTAVNAKNLDLEQLDALLNARSALPVPTSFAALGGDPKDLESNYEILKKRFSGEPSIRYKLSKAKASGDVRAFLPLIDELTALNPTIDQAERTNLLEDSLNMIDRQRAALEVKNAIILGNLFLSLSFKETLETEKKGYRTAVIVRQKIEQSINLGVGKSPESSAKLNELFQKLTNYVTGPQSNVAEVKPNQGPGIFGAQPKSQVGEPSSVLDEKKIFCNRANLPDICREVGLILTKRLENGQFGYQTPGLQDEALSYLRKAVAAGDLVAHRYIFDTYETKQLLTEEERIQSDRSLDTLLSRGDIGGELRRHLKIIRTNPLNQIVTSLGSILTGRNSFADSCSKVKVIIGSNKLDDYDRGLAAAALDSITCKR